MLVVAQLYKEKLEDEILKTWYKRENIYWHGGPGEYTVQLDDNNRDSLVLYQWIKMTMC